VSIKKVTIIICGLLSSLSLTGCIQNSPNNITPEESDNFIAPHVDFTFSPENPVPNEIIQFNDASIDVNNTIVSWNWDFGDNNISTDQNPKHTYASKGNYTVTLTIKSDKNLSNSTTKIVPIVVDDFSIITPYVNEDDIDIVPEAYGLASTNPYWNFSHGGIDFKTSKDLIPVRASASGTITRVQIAKENNQMGWHAGFSIQHDNFYSVFYNLETFSQSDEVGQKLRDNMFITEGQIVNQGDIIANLVYGGEGCHIDFGVIISDNRVCPEPYFTEEARASVMRLIQKDHPDWPMCTD
jgi:hypothetical protein